MMQTWEYKLFEPKFKPRLFDSQGLLDGPAVEPQINQLGADGWELMTIVPPPPDSDRFIFLFKRPK
jgi:hypothetical protein